MKKDDWIDEPVRREKENMDEPQEEFISDTPPSRSEPSESDSKDTSDQGVAPKSSP